MRSQCATRSRIGRGDGPFSRSFGEGRIEGLWVPVARAVGGAGLPEQGLEELARKEQCFLANPK